MFFPRRAVVNYWRKYVHEVLVNRLGGLSLPRKSVVRLTDRPDMTLDVYCGHKTTTQQQQLTFFHNFYQRNDLDDFLFSSLNGKALPKWGLLLKERICSSRSKFFPLRVDPSEKAGKDEKGNVASFESVHIHVFVASHSQL